MECPHCHNPIYDEEALLCHFCGESLRRPKGVLGRLKYGPFHRVWILILAIVILGMLVFLS